MKNSILIPIFSATLLWACGAKKEKAIETEKDTVDTAIAITYLELTQFQFKSAGMELGLIEQKNMVEIIKASGKLDVPPQNFAEVSTYIGGIVKSIKVLEGDFVKQGQTIMILEHPDYIKLQEEYMSIKSDIDFLEKEYLRQKELYEQKVSSGKVFQQAQSKYNVEKGRLASLESQLSLLSISTAALDNGIITKSIPLKAPISGYIGHLKASIGGYAEPNKALFDIINNSDIHVHLDVFEKDLAKLKIGQKVMVSLPNQDGNQIEAIIFSIGKMLNEQTKTVEIHADVSNSGRKDLIPGTYVNAEINVEERMVSAISETALVRIGEKQFVFVASQSRITKVDKNNPYRNGDFLPGFSLKEVKTGSSANGLVEIIPLEKLEADAQIVVKGSYFLISQLKSGETVGCCAPGEKEEK